MDVVMADDHDLAYWQPYSKQTPRVMVMTAPDGMPGVEGCSAVGTINEHDQIEVHVAWTPSPEDLDRLTRGGQVWVSMLGGLMPHYVVVSPPVQDMSSPDGDARPRP